MRIRSNNSLTEQQKTEQMRRVAMAYLNSGRITEQDYNAWAQLQGVATDLSYSMGSGLNGALKNASYKLKNY